MEDKNEKLEVIEERIGTLQKSIMERFDLAVVDAKEHWDRCNEDNLERINDHRKALIKELDDKLALIKQFPSVLDADMVNVVELTEKGTKEIRDNWGRLHLYLDDRKWKVLILAKRMP